LSLSYGTINISERIYHLKTDLWNKRRKKFCNYYYYSYSWEKEKRKRRKSNTKQQTKEKVKGETQHNTNLE